MTPSSAPTLLVIDDDARFRRLLVTGLQRASYHVLEAASGVEALPMIDQHPVSLVITDIVMPDMEGLELITRLRQNRPDLKIIAMSGGGRLDPGNYLHMAEVLGASRVLAKPFSVADLLRNVRELLPEQ
ncbi:MAG TPA: response regulator [Methylomirabilota bacterium]|nr:response regulator [Methylomirabilota bacterium]